jgi:hypothetical protein
MNPKKFIYHSGQLIPKKIEKGINTHYLNQENNNEYKFINLSRNDNKINPPNIMPNIFLSEIQNHPTAQSQEEQKVLYESNNINEETQTNSTFRVNNFINKINESSNDMSKKFDDDSHLFYRNNLKVIKKPRKATLYWQIEQICKHFYLNQDNDDKENIFSEMYQKENEYVKNLNKNFLNNDDIIFKRKYSYRNFSRLIKYSLSEKNNSFNHYKTKINKSYKSNKKNNEEIIKKYFDEENKKPIDIKKRTKYNFENYGIDSYRYKHPQIYKLKIEDKVKLPSINKSKKVPIELANIIPIKKGINKEEKVNEYKFYKIMKNNRLKKFHV